MLDIFEPIFEQNANMNFEPIFEKSVKFGPCQHFWSDCRERDYVLQIWPGLTIMQVAYFAPYHLD